MKRYVDYLHGRAQDHIVSYGLGDWGDFPSVKEHQGWAQLTPVSLTDTAIFYHDTAILAQVAAILGRSDDARRYKALADDVRTAFNRAFFNPNTNRYISGTPVVPNELRHDFNRALFDPVTNTYVGASQASQAIPLALGITDPDRAQPVFDYLVEEVRQQEYATVGEVGHLFLLRALADCGRSDVIFTLHNRTTNPGYGWQITKGLTALGEAWDGRAEASMNHCQMGHLQEWFHAWLLGIQPAPDAVAFKRFVIRPQVVGDLRWAKGSYNSIRGKIAVEWHANDNHLTITVAVPPNTSAILYVPTADARNVREGDRPAAESPGVEAVGMENGAAKYLLQSGNYVFLAPIK